MDTIEEPRIQEITMEEPMEGEQGNLNENLDDHLHNHRDNNFSENREEPEPLEESTEVSDLYPEDREETIPTEIFLAPAAEDVGDKLLDQMAVEPEQLQPQEMPAPVQQSTQPSFAHLSFEEASGTLRDIIGRLERGNTSLEESLSLYQEGKQLISYCQGKISNVKEQVLILKPQGAGGPPLEETFTREKRI